MNRARKNTTLAATVLAALLVVSPVHAQESGGSNGIYDLREYWSNTSSAPPTDQRVLDAIPDRSRYAALSEEVSEMEAAYDEAVAAEEKYEEQRDAAYDAGGDGDQAHDKMVAAGDRADSIQMRSQNSVQELVALEDEGEDEMQGKNTGSSKGMDDFFQEPGMVGAAAPDAQPEPAPAPQEDAPGTQESAPAQQPQPAPQQAEPYVQPDDGGGGLNPINFLILLAVLGGVAAVFGPRLLARAQGLPGGERVSAAMSKVGKPVQARAPEDPDRPKPGGPAPRMEPWRPDDGPKKPSPTDGPTFGPIKRVPDPAPTPPPPDDLLDDLDDLLDDLDDEPTRPRPGAPRNGRPRPRPTASDQTLTPEERDYFGSPETPAQGPRERSRPGQAKGSQGERPGAAPAVAKKPGPPTAEEKELLRKLPELLRERTIGQDHACDALAEAVQGQRVGFGGERPVSVMFAGTTGVGKTETAKALADALFGGEDKMIRLDMSEYQDKLQASRFVGAPPGYVGFEDVPPLVTKMLEDPRRVVLFDEIEKAHPDVLTYLLQILDDGRLTSSKGETLDFTGAVVVLTSNLGSEEIRRRYEAGAEGIPEREAKELLREKGMRPELVARIGEIVTFRPLRPGHVQKIAKLMLRKTAKKFAVGNDATLELTDEAVAWVGEKGYEPENGARPLRGVIAKHVEKLLSRAVLADEISTGDTVTIDVSEDGETLAIRGGDRSEKEPRPTRTA